MGKTNADPTEPLAAARHDALSERLRGQRLHKRLSLRELARRLHLSPSLLSQIETGKAKPSITTLYALVQELDLSMDDLFANGRSGTTAESTLPPLPVMPRTPAGAPTMPPRTNAQAQGPIYRAGTRKVIVVEPGLRMERLANALDPDVDIMSVVYEPGASSTPTFLQHPGREFGVVLSGRLGVSLQFDDYIVAAGDSITFDAVVPHRIWNPDAEPAQAIWMVVGHMWT